MCELTEKINGSSSVTLPNDLLHTIEQIIENTNLGYKSRAEFVKDAIRNQIKALKLLYGTDLQKVTNSKTLDAFIRS